MACFIGLWWMGNTLEHVRDQAIAFCFSQFAPNPFRAFGPVAACGGRVLACGQVWAQALPRRAC